MTFAECLLCDSILLHAFLETFRNWGTGVLGHFTKVRMVNKTSNSDLLRLKSDHVFPLCLFWVILLFPALTWMRNHCFYSKQ